MYAPTISAHTIPGALFLSFVPPPTTHGGYFFSVGFRNVLIEQASQGSTYCYCCCRACIYVTLRRELRPSCCSSPFPRSSTRMRTVQCSAVQSRALAVIVRVTCFFFSNGTQHPVSFLICFKFCCGPHRSFSPSGSQRTQLFICFFSGTYHLCIHPLHPTPSHPTPSHPPLLIPGRERGRQGQGSQGRGDRRDRQVESGIRDLEAGHRDREEAAEG